MPLLGKVLVTAGNTVIGVSNKHNELAGVVNGIAPPLTPVTATVTGVLRNTGQTVVDLGNGQSAILNGVGGKLGDVVKLDLASKTVVGAGAGSPLIGVGVLSPTASTGKLAAVNVGNSAPLVTVGGGGGVLTPVGNVVAPVTNVVNNVAAPVKTVAGTVLAPVTGAIGGARGPGSLGLVANVGAALGVSAAPNGPQAGATVGAGGLLGLRRR